MSDLKIVLKRIGRLDEIIHQEERNAAYLKSRLGSGHGQADWDPAGGDSWVSERRKAEIASIEDSLPKYELTEIESARSELGQIYNGHHDFSEWYSAIYAAGAAINIPEHELDANISGWIRVLNFNLKATIPFEGREMIPFGEDGYDNMCRGRGYSRPVTLDVPDGKKRLKAIEDAGRLFRLSRSASVRDLLRRESRQNSLYEVRREASRYLGVFPGVFWAREHPYKAIAAGIGILTAGLILASELLDK